MWELEFHYHMCLTLVLLPSLTSVHAGVRSCAQLHFVLVKLHNFVCCVTKN